MFRALAEWYVGRRGLAELRDIRRREATAWAWKVEWTINEAQTALHQQDTERASQLWDEACAVSRAVAYSSENAADVLIGLGRSDDAEALALRGMQLDKRNPAFAQGYAYVAERRGDWEEAVRRWHVVRRRFPDRERGWQSLTHCLIGAGRPAEAEAVALQGMAKFPDDLVLHLHAARCADQRADWPAALERWRILRDRFDYVGGAVGMSQALRELDRLDEADEVAAAGRYRHPGDIGLGAEAAKIAERRGDWDMAARRWAEVRRRFPNDPMGYVEGAKALSTAGDRDGLAALAADAREHVLGVELPIT
jgi:tetratricopeptide (TPR) repeat protein